VFILFLDFVCICLDAVFLFLFLFCLFLCLRDYLLFFCNCLSLVQRCQRAATEGGGRGGASPADLSFLNKGKRAGSYSSRAAALVGAVAGAPVQKKKTNFNTAASCHEVRDTHHRDKVTQGGAIRSMFHKLLVP